MERAPEAGEALSPRGRARRWRTEEGELWRLEEAAVAERLLDLARDGVGGFVRGGKDSEGPWLLRQLPGATLSSARRDETGPWAWRRAADVALGVARALARCEAASLFPGSVTPSTVLVGDSVCVPAEALVSALSGDAAGGRRGGSDTQQRDLLWAPPEAVDTAVWDSAANRYALGVMLYEMLAGAHPFSGAGLRHALAEAQQHEAAPFVTEIARELPPGLQSLVLRWIARDPSARPARAAAMVAELEEVTGERAPVRAAVKPVAEEKPAVETKVVRRGRAQPLDLAWLWGRGGQVLPALLGLVIAGLALAWALDERPPPTAPRIDIGALKALDAAHTRAGDCAACHPRHAAEWSQSVMGHAVKSPLFNALEQLIEEQVGRDRDCPGGAGILRRSPGASACRDPASGLAVTGSGGEHWCVNCHSPGDNLGSQMPPWEGRIGGDPRSRHPVRDLIGDLALEGISCAFCHQVEGPVGRSGSGGYEGNPSWVSFVTGALFLSRPEDQRGRFGIANSGYRLSPRELLGGDGGVEVHARPSAAGQAYLASSEFCGGCHDVRLFGTDVLGSQNGEHFKRLRNAYTEWVEYGAVERGRGREPASCQGCHMSTFPGVCVAGEGDALSDEACPEGMHFEARAPGSTAVGRDATTSSEANAQSSHYFTSVDLPLARDIADAALDQAGVDLHGVPLSARKRRDLLLRESMRFELGEVRRTRGTLELPLTIENVGAGHKVPAGFSQEREIWVHLRVEDGSGRVLYEVGRVEANEEDLRDKVFVRVSTDPDRLDFAGRPEGLFGAEVRDGADAPRWSPPPELGGNDFRGSGLINFQNGFLRCVRCIGEVSAAGECLPLAFDRHRASRFADGDYDIDTGECRSNLFGRAALFETYFPVGALDADRGLVKGPDAIIDTRSLSYRVPKRYTYVLPTQGRRGPFSVTARLMFRSFPPFLVRAFAEYEEKQAARGRRPSGALVTFDMLARLERVEVARGELVVP